MTYVLTKTVLQNFSFCEDISKKCCLVHGHCNCVVVDYANTVWAITMFIHKENYNSVTRLGNDFME